MKRITLAAAIALAFAAPAFAGTTFSAGIGSSASTSGGSEATSGVNGTGYSSQYDASSGFAVAAGGTGFAAGVVGNGQSFGIGATSFSGTYNDAGSYAVSSGVTAGGGYGSGQAGSANNVSSYSYGNINASYSY